MDWSKAKNILIIALLATNIFLLVTYMTNNENESSITDHEVLFSVLEGENVFFDTEMPKRIDRLPAITLTYRDCSDIIGEKLKSEEYVLGDNLNEDYYEKMATKFLKDCELYNDNIRFDSLAREGNRVVVKYNNYYKDIKIGGSCTEIIFENERITDASVQFVAAEEKSKRKLNVISPEEALLIFMSEKDYEKNVTVEDMELVFWVNDSTFDGEMLVSDTAFPAWQISYNNGNIKYIEAYRE